MKNAATETEAPEAVLAMATVAAALALAIVGTAPAMAIGAIAGDMGIAATAAATIEVAVAGTVVAGALVQVLALRPTIRILKRIGRRLLTISMRWISGRNSFTESIPTVSSTPRDPIARDRSDQGRALRDCAGPVRHW
jgi:hypothetical protein